MAKRQPMTENRHHILFCRRSFEADMANHYLRNKVGLIVLMDVGIHRELHQDLPEVPPLGRYLASLVRNELKYDPNPLRAVDTFQRAVDTQMEHPRVHRLEREMAELTLAHIDLQLPYIREGIAA